MSYNIKVWRKSDSSENTVSFDLAEVISIYAEQVATMRIGEARLMLDNDPAKDVKVGDDIEIYFTTAGPTLHKVFEGVVTNVKEKRSDDEASMEIDLIDWGELLLEEKATKYYPVPPSTTPINADTIVVDLVENLSESSVNHTQRKITIENVESTTKKRQLDFIGESLYDCIKQVAEASQHEFYVDENKDLNFFAKGSRSSGFTLTQADLLDYNYSNTFESLCNKAYCYGAQNKCLPLNKDDWTESTISWSDDGSSGGPITLVADSPAGRRKGDYAIHIYVLPNTTNWVHLKVKRDLPTIDLTNKQDYNELVFVAETNRGDLDVGGSKFIVELIDSSSNRISYPAGDRNGGWYVIGSGPGTIPFSEFHIPTIPNNTVDWTLSVGSDFDWSAVEGIAFASDIYIQTGTTNVNLRIDWLHFDRARWYGEYQDSTSVTAYGPREKEIFDETIFTDAAALRRAKEYILSNKDVADIWENILLDTPGMESIDPGDTISMAVPEKTMDVRIEEVHHRLDEDDYTVQLILASDPEVITASIKDISDRARRLEQLAFLPPRGTITESD